MTQSSSIKTVYLAGPMTGLPDFNYPKFNAMARSIRARGFTVFNPAESFNGDQTKTRNEYVLADVKLVESADAVAVMRDWENSSGTRFETHQASLLGKPVIDAEVLAMSGVVVRVNTDRFGAPLPTVESIGTRPEHQLDGFWDSKVNAAREERVKDTPFKSADHLAIRRLGDPGYRFAYRPDPTTLEVKDFAGVVDGGGYKGSMDDTSKLPLWLVPNALTQAAARALQHGAAKYAPNNWRRGMNYSEVYSALQRHLTAWLEGDDLDKDTHLNHLDHAAACLAFLTEYVAQPSYAKFDNRFKRPKPDAAPSPDVAVSQNNLALWSERLASAWSDNSNRVAPDRYARRLPFTSTVNWWRADAANNTQDFVK